MRAMKKLGIVLVILAVVAGVAVFWLNRNIDGLVQAAIEKYGSEMTRAKVSVASVEIKPADGRGVIRGLTIGNPAGFKTAHAVRAAEIEVAIDLASPKAQASAAFLAGKTVEVKLPTIALRDLGKAKGGVTPGELG